MKNKTKNYIYIYLLLPNNIHAYAVVMFEDRQLVIT